MEVLKFIKEQILGMKFLNEIIGQMLIKAGLDINSKFGGSLQFFIYDTIKIFILLLTMIFIISYIQSYFPPERSRQVIGKYKGIYALIIAALLGTITPFCSCSSIPLFRVCKCGASSWCCICIFNIITTGGFRLNCTA